MNSPEGRSPIVSIVSLIVSGSVRSSVEGADSFIMTTITNIPEGESVISNTTSAAGGIGGEIPPNFRMMSELSKNCVIAYSILFIFASVGNVSVFCSVLKQMRHYRNRISLLILHLSLADLLVTFFVMPLEIFWRITIQWYGGDFLCKFCQFFRAFGLYLSSMVVICISLDRYFAIIYPLKLARAAERVKITLGVAWIFAVIFAAPQIFVFKVVVHPDYPSFRQCITETFLKSDMEQELVYNVFSVSVLYFIPLLMIMFTYSRILCKLYRKSKKQADKMEGNKQITIEYRCNKKSSVDSMDSANDNSVIRITAGKETDHDTNDFKVDLTLPSGGIDTDTANDTRDSRSAISTIPTTVLPNGSSAPEKPFLRKSCGSIHLMARARIRTLRLTCIIVLSFVFCWTPYVVMTLWYVVDRQGAKSVDLRLQEGLFIMAVSNSVVNPLIYGTYGNSDCLRGSSASAANRYGNYDLSNRKGRRSLPINPNDRSQCLSQTRRSTLGTINTVTSVVIQNYQHHHPNTTRDIDMNL